MIEKLYLDTNVLLDLLGERKPFYESAARIATLADTGKIKLFVSSLSYSTVYYILSRFEHHALVKEKLRKFRIISEVSDVTGLIIDKALTSNFSYFEDAIQYHCSLADNCNILITRNGKDYKNSVIPVMSPDEYVASLNEL